MQQKKFPTRPFFLTGVETPFTACPFSILASNRFLMVLFCNGFLFLILFLVGLIYQKRIIPHCIVGAVSPVKQVCISCHSFPPFMAPACCVLSVSVWKSFSLSRYGELSCFPLHICGFFLPVPQSALSLSEPQFPALWVSAPTYGKTAFPNVAFPVIFPCFSPTVHLRLPPGLLLFLKRFLQTLPPARPQYGLPC